MAIPAAAIPISVLINTSKDGDVVTSPENIDRATGAYESSINATKQMVNSRIEQRAKEANKEQGKNEND